MAMNAIASANYFNDAIYNFKDLGRVVQSPIKLTQGEQDFLIYYLFA